MVFGHPDPSAPHKAVSEDDDDDIEEDEEEAPPPKTTKRTNRAAVLRCVRLDGHWGLHSPAFVSQSTVTKKAPAKRSTAKSQATLSFAPSGRSSTRAAASRATKRMADVVSLLPET